MKKYAGWILGVAVVAVLVVLLVVGCTPTTASLLTEGKEVTRPQFQSEVKQIVAEQAVMQGRIADGDAELDAQEARNKEALQAALDIAGSAVRLIVTGEATAASAVGLGIMGGLAGLWTVARRRANNGDAVGGVVVQAVDVLRENPETQQALEAALKNILAKTGMSAADYSKAIAMLMEKAAA